jgi:predicted  nucleic acid-binding Zn-ribbon protein
MAIHRMPKVMRNKFTAVPVEAINKERFRNPLKESNRGVDVDEDANRPNHPKPEKEASAEVQNEDEHDVENKKTLW